jgi:hypothetical protein
MPRITLSGFAKETSRRFILQMSGVEYWGKTKVYLNFLQNILPILLKELDLHRRQNMWHQKNGAPAHLHREMRRYLDTLYANKWN